INAVILLVGLRAKNRRRDHLYGSTQSSAVLTTAESTSCDIDVERIDIADISSIEDRRRWGYENMSEQEIRNLGDQHATW
ncbi:unnamed protein product, partial [Rotaria sp. Silwood1]